MQPITVMMVETDQDQSIAIEDLLKNNKEYIQILNEIKNVGNNAAEVNQEKILLTVPWRK